MNQITLQFICLLAVVYLLQCLCKIKRWRHFDILIINTISVTYIYFLCSFSIFKGIILLSLLQSLMSLLFFENRHFYLKSIWTVLFCKQIIQRAIFTHWMNRSRSILSHMVLQTEEFSVLSPFSLHVCIISAYMVKITRHNLIVLSK